jgi:hypothetical protein
MSSMKNGLVKGEQWDRAGLALAMAGLLMCLLSPVAASGLWPSRHRNADSGSAPQRKGPSASQPPAFSILVESLGFSAPGPFYLGLRERLVSLDFLDENLLLFTFRAPGLIHRTNASERERRVRTEVLTLPQGRVEAEALWTLHDQDRYLWMLRDGHFLLRDENAIQEGDARLELRPLLQFPGPLLSIAMDPAQEYLVTNSLEPAPDKDQKGEAGSPPTAHANVTTDAQDRAGQRDIVLRILERKSGQVMLVSRARLPMHLPIDSDGYIETLRGTGKEWVLNHNFFRGGSKIVGKVNSTCQPPVEFVSQGEVVANTCLEQGGRRLIALSTGGQKLWEAASAPTQIWPLLVMGPDGSRLVRETLTVDQPIDFGHPLDAQSIRGQLVEVFDAAGGKLLLKAPATPVLDGGGNVAISPSGRRVAVLNAGAIEVYDLPGQATGTQATSPKR